MARKASARYVTPPRDPVTSESLGTVLRSGGSCQENKQTNKCIAARKNFERAVGRPRPEPDLLTPGSRPPPRTALVCSLPAPGTLNSRVLLRIPIGSVDVGTTTTLLPARALPNNCTCVHSNSQHNPGSPSPALFCTWRAHANPCTRRRHALDCTARWPLDMSQYMHT